MTSLTPFPSRIRRAGRRLADPGRSSAAAPARGSGRCRAGTSPSSTCAILGGASPFQRTLERARRRALRRPDRDQRRRVALPRRRAGRGESAPRSSSRSSRKAATRWPRSTLAACLAARRDPLGDRPRDALRPPDPRRRGLRPRRRRRGAHRRRRAGSSSSASRRPSPPPPTATSPAARRSPPAATRSRASWRSPTPPGPRELIAAGLPVERRHVLLPRRRRPAARSSAHAPEALEAVRARDRRRPSRPRRAAARRRPSSHAPKISFDHAVMERTDRAAVRRGGLRLVRHRRLEGGLGAEPARRAMASPARAGSTPATSPTATSAPTAACSACSASTGLAVVDTPDARPGRADRAGAGGQGPGRRARGRRRPRRRTRRRGSTGPGAGTRPSTSATASG